jgi:4-hydroxy-3-methylbut-2-en-1-yl diphosphate synthase IspG/GcpE
VDEIKVGFDILKSLGLRQKGVNLIACPSCSRQKFDVIKVVNTLEARLEDINEPIDVAVIGCVVNGPGEAKAVSVGLTGGEPNLASNVLTTLITSNFCREQEGQAIKLTPFCRKPSDFKISKPTLISSTGSEAKEMAVWLMGRVRLRRFQLD